MIVISDQEYLNELQSPEQVPVLFFTSYKNPAAPDRWVDTPMPIEWNGNTYKPFIGMTGLTIPEDRGELNRNLFTLNFVDVDPSASTSWSHYWNNSYGTKLEVKLAFAITDANPTSTNAITQFALDFYTGRYVYMSQVPGGNNNYVTQVQFAGLLYSTRSNIVRKATHERQIQIDPTDNSHIYAGSEATIGYWGPNANQDRE